MSLVLKLLGAIQVTWQDIPLKFATDHARALLAYLAVEANVVHQRTTIATLLWPEDDDATSRHNLRQALFFLKRTLAVAPDRDVIFHVTPTTLQWISQGVDLDLHAFQRLWQVSQSHQHANLAQCAPCNERFAQAISLYQGEFLQGFLLKHSQLFEEWLLLLREQSHRQAMAMLGALTAYHATAGAYDQVQRYASRQVALEPWHEEGHRQLMWALAMQGQPSAALRQYESCRRTLQQELGVPPAAETTQLYEQIRDGRLLPAVLAPMQQAASQGLATTRPAPQVLEASKRVHNLPRNLAPLVGRSQQLEHLRALIGNPGQRLLTIVGIGGMGKSRLALALLEQLVAEAPAPFTDGVWFIPLLGVAASAETLADAVAETTLKALGMTTLNQEASQSTLLHFLAQRHLLLVFDNFEHLLLKESTANAAAEFVLALLHAAPGATLVITSRLPLQLLTETVIRLEGLPVPGGPASTVDRRDAANYESIRLFVYHAQRALPAFTLHDDNFAAVIALCRALSGMPLAIELAAALTPHFTPSELVTALGQNLALLASTRRDLDARHRQFSAVLESSWQLLSTGVQQVLAQSAIFVGPFSRAAAQMVTGATVSDLGGLVDLSLVQQAGVGVYQLHDLLRQFAAQKLQTFTQEVATVADRHSAFYLDFVAQRERMLTRHAPRQAVAEIQQVVANVRQAWTWAATHTIAAGSATAGWERMRASAYGLCQFYLIAGLYTEGIVAFDQAIAGVEAALTAFGASVAPIGGGVATSTATAGGAAAISSWQALLSTLLAFKAYLLAAHAAYDNVQAVAERAIALGRAFGSLEGEVIGLVSLAQGCYHGGQWGAAKRHIDAALARLDQLQPNAEPGEFAYDAQVDAYLYLGAIAKNKDDYDQAQSHFSQVLQLCHPLGNLRGEMRARLNLANLARHKQNYTTARADYEQVLQIACALGYRRGEALARYELADVMRGQGEYSAALEQYARALAILREIGELEHENYIEADLARIYAYLGAYGAAEELVQQALLRCDHFSMPDAKVDVWLTAALLHHHAGEETEALRFATCSQQVAREHSSRRYEGCAWLAMGNALVGLGRWSEAVAAFANALRLFEQLDIQPVAAEAQAGLARVALAQGDPVRALAWVEKILPILADQPTVGLDEPFQVYLTCYQILAANADPRGGAILQHGMQELERYATQIADDELRRFFLTRVPTHRALQQAYRATLGVESLA